MLNFLLGPVSSPSSNELAQLAETCPFVRFRTIGPIQISIMKVVNFALELTATTGWVIVWVVRVRSYV